MTPIDVLEATATSATDAGLDDQLKAYEVQLRKEMGLEDEEINHFARPVEHRFVKNTRETTTVLFGGLTVAHDHLIQHAVSGLGYKVASLEVPDNEALSIGKEFGNRGQCNPTYYTVGNLVKHLQKLRDNEGLTVPEIKDKYVFLTAGACGPCRFGMYEAEYRKALRDAGFEGFRVLLFEQTKGISQAAGDEAADEGGIDFNKDFFRAIIAAVMTGDLLNDLGYQIRPYEKKTGSTDKVLAEARRLLGDAMQKGEKFEPVLKAIRPMFDAIECDYTRVKPKVKITGEFWAMTTEGDGNYHMARWLESEGAQVLVEPVITWVDYLLYIAKHDLKNAWGVADKDGKKFSTIRAMKTYALLSALKIYFRGRYDKYRKLLGMKAGALPDQKKIHKLAQQYYNIDLRGGEGHMEVGKNIYSVLEKKAHMVISVKPFGCMPSTQSDGVQSKVVNDYPECIFIPIETSGDGEINIKSRVQMKLYEAKVRCREEFNRVLEGYGFKVEQFREYVDKHAKFSEGLLTLPHEEVGVASNLLHMVAKRMKAHFKGAAAKQILSAEEVARLAREQAKLDGAACLLEADKEVEARAGHSAEFAHGQAEGGCCGSGECGDGLPGEKKERTPAQTVKATTSCGSNSCDCE